jgi:hypothetical protein
MQKVSHCNLHLPLGASMEDSTTCLLGEVDTKQVLNKQQKKFMEFEIHISKLKKKQF